MVRAIGGRQGSASVTPRIGLAPLGNSPDVYNPPIATGLIESPYGTKTISGTFRAIRSLSYPPLTSCVEEHLVCKDPRKTQKIRLRETQTSVNLPCLSYLYTFPHTRRLDDGEETWVLSRVSIHRGTIEQLEDKIFNVDELDSAAEVWLCVERSGSNLRISAVDTALLEDVEQRHGMQISFATWFQNMVGKGFPRPSAQELIDPAKLRSVHNRSHLQALYYLPFDIGMVNVMDIDPITWARTDWEAVKTLSDIPAGLVLKMKALVNVAEGHEHGYIEDIFPEEQRIKYDEMKYGVALFTVERRDHHGFIVNWTNASDLAIKGMAVELVQKFRAKAISVYEPDETSLRLAPDNSLKTPAEWVYHIKREPSEPCAAASELGYQPDERSTLSHFSMEEASNIK